MCVAPATAKVLAKAAAGLADDLLSTTLVSVDPARTPVVFVPSMNATMYENPAVRANRATLRERGYALLAPGEGELACGEIGIGRWPGNEPILAAGVLTLLLVVLVFSMNERPWLFTILFTVLTLEAVRGLRQGFAGWSVWGLPLLFVLWANLHIQFVLGLAVLGLGCVAPLLDRWLGLETATGHADTFGSPAWRRLVILTSRLARQLMTSVRAAASRLHSASNPSSTEQWRAAQTATTGDGHRHRARRVWV